MPLTTARNVGKAASRCLADACREVRRDWTHEQLVARQHQAEQMQQRLWGAIHGAELAPARVTVR